MDQVYRSFRKFATILLAMFMFVSIFDAQLIGAEGSSSSAKISHICDEQNILEAKANEELLIPWTSTIETATSDLVNYTEYVGTMETNLWSTPNQLKLIVQEENSGTTRTLVEGTDFKILYQRADGFYEEDKTKVTTFQNFKLQFLDESKTFFKLTVHYNTYGKLSDITDQEEQREFISEGVWKIEHNNKINQSASYIYKNPGYKAVEVEEKDETTANEVTNETKSFHWEDDEVIIKATVDEGILPDNAVLTAELVKSDTKQHNDIVKQIEDVEKNQIYFYKVYFTVDDKKIEVDESQIKTEISLKNMESKVSPVKNEKVLLSQQRSITQNESTVSFDGFPQGYVIWKAYNQDGADHKSNYKYTDFGEQYNLFYILGNYNVFTFDYYYGTHVVGPMIVGGEAAKQQSGADGPVSDGSLLNVGGTTVPPYMIYQHKAPSYFKGKANINHTVNTQSNVPLFLGNVNGVNEGVYTLVDENGTKYYNYYFDQGLNTYVDFNEAKDKISSQISDLANFQGTDTNGRYVEKVEVTKQALNNFKGSGSYIEKDDSGKQIYEFCKSMENGFGTVLKLKLGYNYVFEEGVLEKIDSIIYDYDSLNEATQTTTFINIPDSSDKITMPYIFKSKSDSLGTLPAISDVDSYQFTNSEVEKGINVAYFMPNAKNIQIGFKKDGAATGLNKLVGHLVAPNANVDIRSGDYNGSIIANKVSSTAEGHMWPFRTDLSFGFNKTVDGKAPEQGEIFTFSLTPKVVPQGATVNVSQMTTQSDETGNINFDMNLYTKEGTYIYEVKEINLGDEYVQNNQKIYVKVQVDKNESNVGYGQLTAHVVGYYSGFANNDVVESTKIDTSTNTDGLTFKNKRKTSIEVEKQWFDSDGSTSLEEKYRSPIDVQLIQHITAEKGYKVRFNIYYKGELISMEETNVVKEQGKVTAHTEHISTDWHYLSNITVTGEAQSSYNSDNYKESALVKGKHNGADIEISNIKSNITVDVNYDCINPSGSVLNKETIKLKYSSDDYGTEKTTETKVYGKSIKLEPDKWTYTFTDLPIKKYENGINYTYTYSVKEISKLENFITSYENNDSVNGIVSGKITIKNILKPYELVIQKASINGSTNNMVGAEFVISNKEGSEIYKFDLVNGKYKFTGKSSNDNDEKTKLITNNKGQIHIEDLPYGEYMLKETKAPSGFIKEEAPIYFEIFRDGKGSVKIDDKIIDLNVDKATDPNKIQYGFVVENTPNIKVPETGGIFDDRYQKFGFLIACGGLAMFVIYECKRSKNMKKSKN